MRRKIFSSKPFNFPYYGLKSGRIEVDLTVPRMPLQRHIWLNHEGNELKEKWIKSISETPDSLIAKGWTKK